MSDKTRRTVLLSLFLAFSLICSYIESCIPFFPMIPGAKLGLSNLVTLFLLYRARFRDAAAVTILRIFLSAFLFSGPVSIFYGLCGAVLSLGGMMLLKNTRFFSPVGVSAAGGMFHNIGQTFAAVLVFRSTAPLFYLSYLMLSGVIAGTLIGIVVSLIIKNTPASFMQDKEKRKGSE